MAPSDTVAEVGSTVLFTCVAYGIPLPSTITWSYYNYTLSNYTNVTIYFNEIDVGGAIFLQSILELCGVEEDYSGYYSCSVETPAGYDAEFFQLIVQPAGECLFLNSSIYSLSCPLTHKHQVVQIL